MREYTHTHTHIYRRVHVGAFIVINILSVDYSSVLYTRPNENNGTISAQCRFSSRLAQRTWYRKARIFIVAKSETICINSNLVSWMHRGLVTSSMKYYLLVMPTPNEEFESRNRIQFRFQRIASLERILSLIFQRYYRQIIYFIFYHIFSIDIIAF